MDRPQPPELAPQATVSARGLAKCYPLYEREGDRLKQLLFGGDKRYFREFWALRDVSFDLARGECVGVIGRNGSGKSTLLQLVAGTLTPTEGTVATRGRVNALLELGSGFNPDFTGRENVQLNASILGVDSSIIRERFDEIAAFADIGEFIERPVRTYSSGMMMRLAFATQTMLEPDILIVDEALAVGDMAFQIKCFARMNQLREKGTAILFVSHSLPTVLSFCERALYLRDGRCVASGPVGEVARCYEQDTLADKMAPRAAAPGRAPASAVAEARDAPTADHVFAAATMALRPLFLETARQGGRKGSGTATVESFAFLRPDGTHVDHISPLEDVVACCVFAFRAPFEGGLHLSLQVLDRTGNPLAVIRDSYFEQTIRASEGDALCATMRVKLPFQAGVYYCRVGLLLFPAGRKYESGQFNFDQAEIADLVEHGAHFTMLPFARHPIPVPVLHESKLTIAPWEGPAS